MAASNSDSAYTHTHINESVFKLPSDLEDYCDDAELRSSKHEYVRLFLDTVGWISWLSRGTNKIDEKIFEYCQDGLMEKQDLLHCCDMRDGNPFLIVLYSPTRNEVTNRKGNSICYVGCNEDTESLHWIISDYKRLKSILKHRHEDKPFFLVIMKTKKCVENHWNQILEEEQRSATINIKFHHSFTVELNDINFIYWRDQIETFALYMAHYRGVLEEEQGRYVQDDDSYCVLL
eukprot:109027_1